MLAVIELNVVMLGVILLNGVAPDYDGEIFIVIGTDFGSKLDI
jgi:hypothetical protein